MTEISLDLFALAASCGYDPDAAGRLHIPPGDEAVARLARAVSAYLADYREVPVPRRLVLTGPAPVWAYLVVALQVRSVVSEIWYYAPNTPQILVWRVGVFPPQILRDGPPSESLRPC